MLPDGQRRVIEDPPTDADAPTVASSSNAKTAWAAGEPTVRLPLGTVCGARSGDKSGNANIGIWARDAGYAWLAGTLDVSTVRAMIGPEAAELGIERFELPNLRAINVVVRRILGAGVASRPRPDPQAKGLGGFLRSRLVDIPEALLRD